MNWGWLSMKRWRPSSGGGSSSSVLLRASVGCWLLLVGLGYAQWQVPAHFPAVQLPGDNALTAAGIGLGKRLFFETRLSRQGQQSCASCHRAPQAFAEPRRFSTGTEGELGKRNSQPIFNLAWRKEFFWDGRAASLREQVLKPIQDPVEMNETLPSVVKKLQAHGSYPPLFQAAFGSAEITAERMAMALEQYLHTLVSAGSRWDAVQQGKAEFTELERRGLELFTGSAGCARCHPAPLFTNQGYANNGLDAVPLDVGREKVTLRAEDRGLFLVPSLRNVGRSAPYMHDGRFNTLEEVLAHYGHGIQPSSTLSAELRGPVRSFSAEEQAALLAFLHSLTDEAFVRQ